MFVVISYDIPDDKRRGRVAGLLLDYGTRVQYSVFECNVKRQDYLKLRQELGKLVEPEEDKVRFYQLCRDCRATVEIIGRGEVEGDVDVFIV